jgi:class 3 adenylate cyclase
VSQDDPTGVDGLLDRALKAAAEGDRETAQLLAGQVLAVDRDNADAEHLLTAPDGNGEIRRLTLAFIDLVDSTALSTQIEPETYRVVVGRYRDDVLRIVRAYGGHVGSTKGDGLLALFGHPEAHEDDVVRAVQAGLDITREVAALSARVRRQLGFDISVRVGVHRGVVYLDRAQDDVYGLAANLAARINSIAAPGTVAVSDAIEPLIADRFALTPNPPQHVKGVTDPVRSYRVDAEREVEHPTTGPLVGRAAETECLQRSWRAAQDGTLAKPGVALIGDAGIGKSRLAWSAVALAEQSGAVVLQLHGSPFYTDVGLRPIRRLLERRCGIGTGSDAAQRLSLLTAEITEHGLDPTATVPLLAPILGIDPAAGYQPVTSEGRRLFEQIENAVRLYLLACLRDGPALLLVEDLHWFDEDTAQVVASLVRADLGGRVLIVMTSRDPVGADPSHAEIFELRPLSGDQADELTVALFPAASDEERAAVRRRCDGVPLYIEEVVAKLRARPGDEFSSAGVPDTLYEALFARLQSSTDALPVVEAAAIIGSRVERTVLASVVDLDAAALDSVIAELLDARVLEPLPPDSWRFRHELLRELAAELSPPSSQRRLHSRIADALISAAADGNPDWPLIARHYERAERFPEAAGSYSQAAANARQRGALREALTYLTYAVSAAERSAPGSEHDRLEIGLRLGRALLAQAAEGVFSANAATDFERCLALCSSDLRDDDLLSTVMSLYPYYTMKADIARAQRLVESIRGSLTGPREAFLPVNDFAYGMLAWYRGEFGAARTQMELAAATLTAAGTRALDELLFMPNDPAAGLYTHLALTRCFDGDLTGVEDELGRAENRCAELPFPKGAFSLAYTRQIEVLIRIEAGDLQRAAAVAVDLANIGEAHGFDSWALVGSAQLATVGALSALAAYDGDRTVLAPHIQMLTSFVEGWRAVGVIALITFYDAILARLLVAAGDPDQARTRLQTGLDLAASTGMRFYDAELLRLGASTTEDPEQRRNDLESAIATARAQDARIFELRSALDYFALDSAAGRTPLAAAVARFPTDGAWPDVARARALLG